MRESCFETHTHVKNSERQKREGDWSRGRVSHDLLETMQSPKNLHNEITLLYLLYNCSPVVFSLFHRAF